MSYEIIKIKLTNNLYIPREKLIETYIKVSRINNKSENRAESETLRALFKGFDH